jgi:sec-independent protein translocase protein TatB
MFGIGFGEMLIIGVILLLAVGPKELPKLMKTVGKGLRDVRRASDDLRKTVGIDALLEDDELRNPLQDKQPKRRPLTAQDLSREQPREGVDLAYARSRAEESARIARTEPLPAADLQGTGKEPGEGA